MKIANIVRKTDFTWTYCMGMHNTLEINLKKILNVVLKFIREISKWNPRALSFQNKAQKIEYASPRLCNDQGSNQ